MKEAEMKTFVITGSTSGIGKALVKVFSKENIVFAGYRNEQYVNDLTNISNNIIPFYIDLNSKSSISQAAAFIKSKTSELDTIINAAGCVVAGAVESIDIEKIKKQFEVNTFSHLDFSQRLLPLIKENGKIINISSMASFGIFPFVAPYCASKRALDILFNSLQLETHRNINIISVKPGVIATPLWGKSIELNKDTIKNCSGYEAEMHYMLDNARNNETKGLDVKKVTDLIIKIEKSANPGVSYTIGNDAKFAEFISKLPQSLLNKLIKFGMKRKFKN